MPCSTTERIGIFGGAFDPPHRGHQKALAAFLKGAELSLVYVIPSGIAPHKALTGGASDEDRLRMAACAFEPVSDRVRISDFEIRSEGVSYTYLTVRHIASLHPKAKLYLFMGTDQYLAFETWKNVPELVSRCVLCPMARDEDFNALLTKNKQLEKEFGAESLLLREKAYIISSTEVRRQLADDGISEALSPAVHDLVTRRGLYGSRKGHRAEWILHLEKELSDKRFRHTLSVERETDRLCRLFDCSDEARERLRLAALCHDATKEWDLSRQVTYLKENGAALTDADLASESVLHGRSAAILAEKIPCLTEAERSAIAYHTTGKSAMTLSEKILFLADFTEEEREYPFCRKIRHRTEELNGLSSDEKKRALDRILVDVMEHTVQGLREKNRPIHPLTLSALEDLKRKE